MLTRLMVSERKEPTVSSVLNSKEELADRRARASLQHRSAVAARAANAPRPTVQSNSSSGFVWFTFLITLIAVSGAAYALWQLQVTEKVIKDQSLRIVQLENKLALSDDSATQSLASVSAKVRELNAKSVESESEVAKLWAARKVNNTAIADSENKIAALEKTITKTATLNKIVNEIKASVDELKSLKAALASTAQTVTEQDLLLQSVRERVANNTQSLQSLTQQQSKNTSAVTKINDIDKRVKNTEGAITSFDAFRRTVNSDLLQLKQLKK
jgi:chromosome segregation ATPase